MQTNDETGYERSSRTSGFPHNVLTRAGATQDNNTSLHLWLWCECDTVSRNAEQALNIHKNSVSRTTVVSAACQVLMTICAAAYCGDNVPAQCVISVVVHFFMFFQYWLLFGLSSTGSGCLPCFIEGNVLKEVKLDRHDSENTKQLLILSFRQSRLRYQLICT